MKFTYKTTVFACFLGYIVQAIINNFIPLLFVTFNESYSIPLPEITLLVTVNFSVQLAVDLISVKFIDKIGYRASMIIAHIFSSAGILSLTFLPELLPPFAGILVSVIIYAIGGGLLEVLVSPIVESCPSENKEKTMSLLHSFYCWGHVGVVLISTLFFNTVGIDNWRGLAVFWAVFPLLNVFIFSRTPIAPLIADGERGMSICELFKSKLFLVFLVMMFAAGASEQAVSQWASAFAELGLGVSKTVGDLAGPLTFAVMMGISRVFYGKFGERVNLDSFIFGSSVFCVFTYLLASLSPSPVLSLIGCSLTGLAVGIMWPGSFSRASALLPRGGTAMFALLALAGDLGCSAGPSLVGFVSGLTGDNLKLGILVATVFPVTMVIFMCVMRKMSKKSQSASASTLDKGI